MEYPKIFETNDGRANFEVGIKFDYRDMRQMLITYGQGTPYHFDMLKENLSKEFRCSSSSIEFMINNTKGDLFRIDLKENHIYIFTLSDIFIFESDIADNTSDIHLMNLKMLEHMDMWSRGFIKCRGCSKFQEYLYVKDYKKTSNIYCKKCFKGDDIDKTV